MKVAAGGQQCWVYYLMVANWSQRRLIPHFPGIETLYRSMGLFDWQRSLGSHVVPVVKHQSIHHDTRSYCDAVGPGCNGCTH